MFLREFAVNEATGRVYFRTSLNGPAPQSQLGFVDESTLTATRLPAFTPDLVNIIRVNGATNRIYVGTTSAAGATRILVLDGDDHDVIATLDLGSPTAFQAAQGYIAIDEERGLAERVRVGAVDAAEQPHVVLGVVRVERVGPLLQLVVGNRCPLSE